MTAGNTWTLIYIGQGCISPQLFVVSGYADGQTAALVLDRQHAWLADYQLVAAVQGTPRVMLMDDARTEERGLMGHD